MVQSAKVVIKQQDRSAIIPALTGIEVGTVINCDWGPSTPTLISSVNDLSGKFKRTTAGTSFLGAEVLAANTDKLWVQRIINPSMKYGAMVVRSQTNPLVWTPPAFAVSDPVDFGIFNGIRDDNAFNNYQFTQSQGAISAQILDGVFVVGATQDRLSITLNNIDTNGHTLAIGDKIMIGSLIPVPGQVLDTIADIEIVPLNTRLIKISANQTPDPEDYLYPIGSTISIWDNDTSSFVAYTTTVNAGKIEANTIFEVADNDKIGETSQCQISFYDGTSTHTCIFMIDQKFSNDSDGYLLTFANATTNPWALGSTVSYIVSDGVYYQDSFLVCAINYGAYGNRISVEVINVDYSNQDFTLNVYLDEDLVETFNNLHLQNFLDGYSSQRFIETVVNNRSKFIKVKVNANNTSLLPLTTSYSVIQQIPDRYYISTNILTSEELFKNDLQVYVNNFDPTVILPGEQVKFNWINSAGVLQQSAEYTIQSISQGNSSFTLNRPLLETEIPVGASISYYSETFNDPTNNIYDGQQCYAPITQNFPYPQNYIGDLIIINNITYKLIDGGVNHLKGGNDGSNITEGDVINAFQKLGNIDSLNVIVDNNLNTANISQAINTIVSNKYAHAFLSVPLSTEQNTDISQILEYQANLNINSASSSLFTGWINTYDATLDMTIPVAPSVYACVAQSFVTRNYQIFTPAAGWNRGAVSGSSIVYQFNEAERDQLVSARINPIRYEKDKGLAVWGNETLYVKHSPLQLRSVAFLLIVLKYGLENYLEFELFELNNERTWDRAETAIDSFIRDKLYLTGGLYDYQVAIKDIITDTDIDNRTMPIFVGIQPTSDINLIPVTIGVFNRSLQITV